MNMGKILLRHALIAFFFEELFYYVIVRHTALRDHIHLAAMIAFAILFAWGMWTFVKLRESKNRGSLR
jgi:hypothetical protein